MIVTRIRRLSTAQILMHFQHECQQVVASARSQKATDFLHWGQTCNEWSSKGNFFHLGYLKVLLILLSCPQKSNIPWTQERTIFQLNYWGKLSSAALQKTEKDLSWNKQRAINLYPCTSGISLSSGANDILRGTVIPCGNYFFNKLLSRTIAWNYNASAKSPFIAKCQFVNRMRMTSIPDIQII